MRFQKRFLLAIVVILLFSVIVFSLPAYAADAEFHSESDSLEVTAIGYDLSESLARQVSFKNALEECTRAGYDSYDPDSVKQTCREKTTRELKHFACTTTLTCLKGEAI